MNKKFLALGITSVVFGLAGTALIAAPTALAAFQQGNLAEAIAAKYNLEVADVESTIQDFHESERSARLDTLIAEGKLTEEQKTKILELEDALHTKMESLRDQDLDRDEMMEQSQAEREALRDYIDEQELEDVIGRGGFGGQRGGGMGQKGGMRMRGQL